MKLILSAFALLLACAAPASAAVTYYYAHPYYGRGDSPFYQGIVDGTIYLEDFEDYRLNTPYVTSTGGGWVADSPADSVDEDDGKDGVWNKGGGHGVCAPRIKFFRHSLFPEMKPGCSPPTWERHCSEANTTFLGLIYIHICELTMLTAWRSAVAGGR